MINKSTSSIKKIKNIINVINDKEQLIKYNNTINLMKDVLNFIKKKKLMLYGGFAINMLLPDKYKFYNKNSINDYDCYSKQAEKDAYELAMYLHNKNYNYIQVKKALHENTFRVYAELIQVIDITSIDKVLYDNLYNVTLKERKTNMYKYYKNFELYIVPFVLLKRNLYYELARPKGSYYRWDKIYTRINLLNKIRINENTLKKKQYVKIPDDLKNIINVLLNYIKTKEYPLVGNYALKLYKNIKDPNCCRINLLDNFFMIISYEYMKTTKDIIKLLKKNLDTKKYNIYYKKRDFLNEIMYNRTKIIIENIETNEYFPIINIVSTEKDCFAIKKINGYTVGSLDTILFFFYSIYIIYFIYSKSENIMEETIYNIIEFEKFIEKNKKNISLRLSDICYGNHIYQREILKKQWKDKKEIKINKSIVNLIK
jgi:hypothetical protein